jgi:RNA polymerase sigma-70 factor (ECF subfamily)
LERVSDLEGTLLTGPSEQPLRLTPAKGQAQPFDEAFAPIAGSMHVLAAALVGRSDAADVVQEACIVALRKYADFKPIRDSAGESAGGGGRSGFHAWMAAIVRHVSSNYRRSDRRRSLRLRLWSRERPQALVENDLGEAPMLSASIDPKLRRAFESLDEDQRVCLLLRIVQGLSYEAISATLSMPEGTVRSHVYRARTRLARDLAQGDTAEARVSHA